MLRAAPWRNTASDLVSLHQDQALSTTIYILRELGPVGFHLKEEGEAKYFKVNIGNPHSCSCSTFLKEKDLCKHICWILLKKFKLPRDHENSFQIGLVDREIDMLLENLHREISPQPPASRCKRKQSFEYVIGLVRQKAVELEDVCPICQEELLKKKQPVTYCRFGCGNNIHIKCMKIWAEHQAKIENENIIKCPLCREEFAPLNLLLEEFKNCNMFTTSTERERLDKHLGIPCNECKVCPIQGKCYKCMSCSDFHLCHKCFPDYFHPQHQFMFREKRNHRWHAVQKASGQPLPSAVIADLMNRDIAPEDYELLLQLDNIRSSSVPQYIVAALPLLVVRHGSKLLLPGQQCRMCLKVFRISQHVRRLPCNHKFHRECIDHWLLHERNSCPIDGQVVYHPLTWNTGPTRDKRQEASNNSALAKPDDTSDRPQFHIPGIGFYTTLKKISTNQIQRHKKQSQEEQRYCQSTCFPEDLRVNGLRCLNGKDIKHERVVNQQYSARGSTTPETAPDCCFPSILPNEAKKANVSPRTIWLEKEKLKLSKISQMKRERGINRTRSSDNNDRLQHLTTNAKLNKYRSANSVTKDILQLVVAPFNGESTSEYWCHDNGFKGGLKKPVGIRSRKPKCIPNKLMDAKDLVLARENSNKQLLNPFTD